MKLLKTFFVISIVASGFYHVNAKDGLINAVKSGDFGLVCSMVDDSTVNETNGSTTPLHEAVKIEDKNEALRIATLLLDRGANIDTKVSNGRTALHEAATLNFSDMVTLLVNRGASILLVDGQKKNALALTQDAEIRSFLLQATYKAAQNSTDSMVRQKAKL